MARAGRVVVDTLALLGERIRPGVTTAELDAFADEYILSQGGEPTFKGYRGYPASICASPNDMVVHDDKWSISTADGSLSAHFEHTVAITDEGPRILTRGETPVQAGLLP